MCCRVRVVKVGLSASNRWPRIRCLLYGVVCLSVFADPAYPYLFDMGDPVCFLRHKMSAMLLSPTPPTYLLISERNATMSLVLPEHQGCRSVFRMRAGQTMWVSRLSTAAVFR